MSKKFLWVDGGDYTEATAYETSDFVASSAGVADAGKPIKLDAGGLIDASMIDDGDIDHGSIGGLGDDDHTQYILASGTRDFSGVVEYSSHPTFSIDTQLVDKKYVDDLVSGTEWQDSVLDSIFTPPGSPTTGDRYLITATATGDWVGQEDKITEWNGTAWVFYTPSTGWQVSDDTVSSGVYLYDGAAWVLKSYEATTASNGVEKVGVDIRLNIATNGGLKIVSDEVTVEPSHFAGEGLIDDGADNLAIDWSTAYNDSKAVKAADLNSTATGKGASIIGVEDANGYFTATNVESVLEELAMSIIDSGVVYTVGVGGVTKGDLVAITSNNTVQKLSITNAAHRAGVGIALETKSAGQTVKILANDTVVTSVLTTATAGTQYYWDGSTHSTTIPSGSGAYVWRTGYAKNATDLAVEVEFLKRNQ